MTATEHTIDRRTFLKGSGALIVGISLPGMLKAGNAAAAIRRGDFIGPALVDPNSLDSWVAIHGDGKVTIFTGKVELGTGVETATMQIAADELDVAIDSIHVVQSDTWQTVDQGFTAGSQSLKTQWRSGLRQAAAEARLALVNMASTKLGVPAGQLTVENGVVESTADASKSVSYAQLIGDQKFNLKQTGKAVPKAVDRYRYVRQSVPRVDVPEKTVADFTYTHDIRLPGMVHGRVVRPPSLDAKLVSIDGFTARMPGVIEVVVKNNFIGVVAEREEQALNAASSLKVKWATTELPDRETFYDDLRNGGPSTDRVLMNTLDVDAKLASAPTVVKARYLYPHQMHGSMGASSGTADVRNGEATVWTSSQGVYQLRAALATLLNMPAQNIHVVYVEGSGCYGLNGADNVVLDAALMSQAVGKPVKVQYARSDEHGWENYGNAMVMDLAAGLDAAGSIVTWDQGNWSYSRGGRPGPPANLPTGVLAGFPESKPAASPPPFPPLGPDSSNAVTNYAFKSQRVVNHSVPGRFFTGPLRSPARIQNTTANESFMDELAAKAGADPVDFRLKHLTDQRLIDVINAAARISGWQHRPSPKPASTQRIRQGRGIAAMQYEGSDAWAAVVVNLDIDTKTGKVRLNHVWAAQDCGIAINPDGMRAQAEGCVVQGISRALKEELKWTQKRITSQDWVTYPVLRFNELPPFDFEIVDRPDQPAVGAGEVVITAIIASIANAIFDATGARLREVPFTPARVRAALA